MGARNASFIDGGDTIRKAMIALIIRDGRHLGQEILSLPGVARLSFASRLRREVPGCAYFVRLFESISQFTLEQAVRSGVVLVQLKIDLVIEITVAL